MRISANILELITALRSAIQQDGEGNLSSAISQELSQLPDFEGSRATAGYRVTPEGDITDDHWWLVMDDDSIFDASDDEPVRCSKKDSRHAHYFPYVGDGNIPLDAIQFANHVKAKSRNTFSDMVEQNAYVMPEAGITPQELHMVEKYADRLFAKVGIDVEFTKHFIARANDPRNEKPITAAELVRLFKQEYQKYGKAIARLGPDAEAVMQDMRTDINVPFALKWDRSSGMLDLISKTVMRKKGFGTSDQVFAIEASGASPSSGVARQSPEALPDAMTMGGQEGVPVDDFDDETRPEDMQLSLDDLLDEDSSAPQPVPQDVADAIEHINQFDDTSYTENDFELTFAGYMHPDELEQYDDFSSWVEVDPDEDTEEEMQFRGSDWAQRAKGWGTDNIPPIIIASWENGTAIADGRGRVQTAIMHDIKIPVYFLKQKGLQEQRLNEDEEYQPETYTIPAGTTLYHGTAADFDETQEDLDPPFWVTEVQQDAEFFVSWHGGERGRVISFKTTEALTLILFHDRNDMNEFSEYMGIDMDYPQEAAEDMCAQGYDGWIIPGNYRGGGSDIMLCTADGLEYVGAENVEMKEVDHPEYMPGGESGTNNYDPTYDERSVQNNPGFPAP